MKFRIFFLLTISLSSLLDSVFSVSACGPYSPIIPTPDFFKLKYHPALSDYDRQENLELWQSLTSENIPLSDIEQVVYTDSHDEFFEKAVNGASTDNLMYIYLKNTGDSEIISFISVAKKIAETRESRRSPWYYPREKNHSDESDDFQCAIDLCKQYDGHRLKDRYSLQVVRAMFASHQFEDCIEYYDSAFASFTDDNLMKRMAQRYVAGCWSRLGRERVADSLFAISGDIWSVGDVEYVMRHNPNAPSIMDYIRTNFADSAGLSKMIPVAHRALKNKNVLHKGDWAYLLAYFYHEFGNDDDKALRFIDKACKSSFNSDELLDLARAYKMKLDANAGNCSKLLLDLKWIENKFDVFSPDADVWKRITRNILYADWIPSLWKKKDYAAAIMLASYADDLGKAHKWQPMIKSQWLFTNNLMPLSQIRKSEEVDNCVDYCSLSFQMMESLSSSELISTYKKMRSGKPLYDFLLKYCRDDADFYHELIGTLALREENYPRAISYLSNVSTNYIRTMNIFKGGFLGRDPFRVYPSRWTVNDYYGEKWESEANATSYEENYLPEAKLEFARQMLEYQQMMRNAETNDEKGWARLMYALGRRNSFEQCWALTQYWRGTYIVGLFRPELDYYGDSFAEKNYAFLFNYDQTIGHERTEKLYRRDVAAALSSITDPESRARAEYFLGNLKTVVEKYPDTPAAQLVKTSCDSWRSWL